MTAARKAAERAAARATETKADVAELRNFVVELGMQVAELKQIASRSAGEAHSANVLTQSNTTAVMEQIQRVFDLEAQVSGLGHLLTDIDARIGKPRPARKATKAAVKKAPARKRAPAKKK